MNYCNGDGVMTWRGPGTITGFEVKRKGLHGTDYAEVHNLTKDDDISALIVHVDGGGTYYISPRGILAETGNLAAQEWWQGRKDSDVGLRRPFVDVHGKWVIPGWNGKRETV